jgi:hypothetical protein
MKIFFPLRWIKKANKLNYILGYLIKDSSYRKSSSHSVVDESENPLHFLGFKRIFRKLKCAKKLNLE